MTDIHMVFVLPDEYGLATADEELSVAQLALGPQPIIFKKLDEKRHRHLKPLYVRGFINGKPTSRMLVDGGAAVKLRTY